MLTTSAEFVTRRYGADAHQKTLAAMTPEAASAFARRGPDGDARPLSVLVAYMEAAQSVLAPGDDTFFVEMGRSAAIDERQRGLSHMVEDRETLIRMLR